MPRFGSLPPQNPHGLPLIAPQTALFLDFDGTLVDLAPQPEAVQVPTNLVTTLQRLGAQLDGALAIVSGRRLTDLDQFLTPLRLPAAAEHGAQRRMASGELIQLPPSGLDEVIGRVKVLAQRHNGLRVEIKSAGVALHYRHAPGLAAECLKTMREVASAAADLELLHGKYVLEIKLAGISKGIAIAAFMTERPFAGRLPLFAGDDVTDETGFAAVQQLGGWGIKVGVGTTRALYRCPSAAALRQWLQHAYQGPALPQALGGEQK